MCHLLHPPAEFSGAKHPGSTPQAHYRPHAEAEREASSDTSWQSPRTAGLIRSSSANQERGLDVIWTEADETRTLCSASPPNAKITKTEVSLHAIREKSVRRDDGALIDQRLAQFIYHFFPPI